MRTDRRPGGPARRLTLIGTLVAATALLIAFCAAAASPVAAAATGRAMHCAAAVGAANVGPSSSSEPQWQTSRDPANPDRVILVSPFDCDEPSTSASGSTSTEPPTTATATATATDTGTAGTTSAPVTGTTAPATTPAPAGPAKVPPPASQVAGALSWTGAGPLLLLAAIALGLIVVGGLLYGRARASRRERA